jgi:hypothetical protein
MTIDHQFQELSGASSQEENLVSPDGGEKELIILLLLRQIRMKKKWMLPNSLLMIEFSLLLVIVS